MTFRGLHVTLVSVQSLLPARPNRTPTSLESIADCRFENLQAIKETRSQKLQLIARTS
jgi:hypothetical protein